MEAARDLFYDFTRLLEAGLEVQRLEHSVTQAKTRRDQLYYDLKERTDRIDAFLADAIAKADEAEEGGHHGT